MSLKNSVIFRGDSFAGNCNLSTTDPSSGAKTAFAIPVGATVTMYFPGGTTSVLLSTSNSGEINITNAATGSFTWTGSPTKSALLTKGANQSVDVVITTTSPVGQWTFEAANILTVKDRANP